MNPLQFGPTEDFDKYPRTLDRDAELLQSVDADYIFCPSRTEMYPAMPGATAPAASFHSTRDGRFEHSAFVDLPGSEANGEGGSRPGFFRGVCTVVSKLFNIVQPDKAFFG